MIAIEGHPTWGELSRLADGELDRERAAGVAGHVASCRRCREKVTYMSELSRAAGEMRHPGPPRDLIDDVLQSREEGRRTILPVAPVGMPDRRRLPAVVAGIAVVAAAALATVFVTSEAGAGASVLRVEPPTPQRGESVTVIYRPASALAGEPTLRLRVRSSPAAGREGRGAAERYREIELMPSGDGEYTATLHRLDATVFQQFAVEDPSGERVDDRQGRLWSLLSVDTGGQPLREALLRQFRALERNDWPAAEQALLRLTELYPRDADGWSRLLTLRRSAGSPDEAATLTAVHREMFRDLQGRALAAPLVPARQAEALARYAAALEDHDAAGYWLRRLESLQPLNRYLVSRRFAERLEAGGVDSALTYLDAVWAAGFRDPLAYENGFSIARAYDRTEEVLVWARRGLTRTENYTWATDAALALVAFPETRSEGRKEVRRLLARLDVMADGDRPLGRSRSETEAEAMRLRRELLISLGRELFRTGEASAALREYGRAEALGGWLPGLYRHRFDARLATGDTTGAMHDLARVEADPILGVRSADSLLHRLGGRPVAELEAHRNAARAEMLGRVLAELPPARPLPRAELVAASGRSVGVREASAGRPTVLALWDRRINDAEAADVLWADGFLRDRDGQILWITPEAHSRALRSFARTRDLSVPRYQDPQGELATMLGEWSGHRYYVIDGSGKIRTDTHDLTEAVRLLEILELESRATA